MIRSIILSAILSSSIIGVAAPCFAQEEVSATVSYADLNLGSKEGAAVLERRIANAVSEVCGTADPRDLAVIAEVRKCQAKAWSGARPKMEQAIASFGSSRYASLSLSGH
jgi:UrcA family protein